MRLILTEDVPQLGTIGTVVNVRNGFARNYLIPRALAVPASESKTKELEHHKRVLAVRREKVLAETKGLCTKIEKLSFEIMKPVGEEDRIFGTVTTSELADLLENAGIKVNRKEIVFDEEVKKVGSYTASLRLHSEVTAKIKFTVAAQAAN